MFDLLDAETVTAVSLIILSFYQPDKNDSMNFKSNQRRTKKDVSGF